MEAAMMCIHLPGVSRFCLEKCCFSPPVFKFIIKLLKFSFFKYFCTPHMFLLSVYDGIYLCKSLSLSLSHTQHIFFSLNQQFLPLGMHITISGPKAKLGSCLPLGPSGHRHSDPEGQS